MELRNCSVENNSDCGLPSECKIPKTEFNVDVEMPNPDSLDVKVVYNKKKYDVSASAQMTIADFKKQLQDLLGNLFLLLIFFIFILL